MHFQYSITGLREDPASAYQLSLACTDTFLGSYLKNPAACSSVQGKNLAGVSHAYSKATTASTGPAAAAISVISLISMLIFPHFKLAIFVLMICCFGTLFAFWLSR